MSACRHSARTCSGSSRMSRNPSTVRPPAPRIVAIAGTSSPRAPRGCLSTSSTDGRNDSTVACRSELRTLMTPVPPIRRRRPVYCSFATLRNPGSLTTSTRGGTPRLWISSALVASRTDARDDATVSAVAMARLRRAWPKPSPSWEYIRKRSASKATPGWVVPSKRARRGRIKSALSAQAGDPSRDLARFRRNSYYRVAASDAERRIPRTPGTRGSREHGRQHAHRDGDSGLPRGVAARPRRHERRVPGRARAPRPQGRVEAARPDAQRRRDVPRPLPARVAPGSRARPPQRRADLRRRRGRRAALHRDALHRRAAISRR